ncbi:MAG: cobalamin B12-binding domain-containing protein [Burkholderiaceae bacterium]|nr:cobalamin B12-binding domain-containing protein [Burkholderiaceae bacterium]
MCGAVTKIALYSEGAGVGQRIRVLLAKPGLDGHDRGVKVIARALVDAGVEVIYTGLHRSPEQIVRAAVDEDVDLVGLSILSGAHSALVNEIMNLMRDSGLAAIPVVVGGTIPEDDRAELADMGVAAVLGPGDPMREAVRLVKQLARPH